MATTTTQSQCRSCDAKEERFRLTLTTTQHNEEAGMRNNNLYRQRLQQRTVGLALAGLEKGGLFVLKKTIGYALIKAVWFAFTKAFCSLKKKRFVRFKNNVLFALKKAVLETVGCVCRGAKLQLELAGHQCRS
jgi:hypothetical protein